MYVHVLCCFALFVCLTLLASFFLPSHVSFKNMYLYESNNDDVIYISLQRNCFRMTKKCFNIYQTHLPVRVGGHEVAGHETSIDHVSSCFSLHTDCSIYATSYVAYDM